MPDRSDIRTFTAETGAGQRPWQALFFAVPAVVVGFYFLEPVVAGVVAVVTAVVVVPLALRYRRLEATSEVDVSVDAVVHRRGGAEVARLDRRSPRFEVMTFTDSQGMIPQLLMTDGTQYVRLVRGQWRQPVLDQLAEHAAGGTPRVATWKDIKADHRPALAFYERHTAAIIAGTLVGIPVLVIVGGILAVLLFDVG